MMGYIFGLTCALTWSIGVVLLKRTGDQLNPVTLNMFKNVLGFALMVPTLWMMEGKLWVNTTKSQFAVVALSGVLGIGLADMLFLYGLKVIGATRTAIIDCLYSPFIILLSLLFLAETLSGLQVLGAAVVIAAVLLVNTTSSKQEAIEPRLALKGSVIAAFAILLMALGVTMIKPVLTELPLFFVIALRLLAGCIVAVAFWSFVPDRIQSIRKLFDPNLRWQMLAGCFMLTYISMIFWVAGFKYAQASIVAVLNQMSTIFTVLFAALVLKEPMTRAKIIATGLATSGVLLILFAQTS